MSVVRRQKDMKEVKDVTPSVKEDIDLLWEEAKKQGYSSIRDYVKHQYQNFDSNTKLEIIEEKFDDFLTLVQTKADKLYSIGKWGVTSTFREYLHESVLEINNRLEQLEFEYKNRVQSFGGMITVLPYMKDTPAGMGEAMSTENYEFYSLIYNKCREFFIELLNNSELYNNYLDALEERAKSKKDNESLIDKVKELNTKTVAEKQGE